MTIRFALAWQATNNKKQTSSAMVVFVRVVMTMKAAAAATTTTAHAKDSNSDESIAADNDADICQKSLPIHTKALYPSLLMKVNALLSFSTKFG